MESRLLKFWKIKLYYDVPQSTLNFFFPFFQWNGSTINHFKIERDFGTDYGICCWYTPQLNYSEIHEHQVTNNLHEPAWGHWFTNIKKVSIFFPCYSFALTKCVNIKNFECFLLDFIVCALMDSSGSGDLSL